MDSDDLDPRFTEETYTAKVTSGVSSGALRVLPEKIRAEDGDTLRSRIRYSFASGSPPSYREHFSIDPDTGIVRQTRPVQKSGEAADLFDIAVKAEEATPSRRSAKARLLIQVLAQGKMPPSLSVTSERGFVPENSDLGARVEDKQGNDVRFLLSTKGEAAAAGAAYEYELTTTFFRVDSEGYLVVAEKGLDRDPPNEPMLRFQVF